MRAIAERATSLLISDKSSARLAIQMRKTTHPEPLSIAAAADVGDVLAERHAVDAQRRVVGAELGVDRIVRVVAVPVWHARIAQQSATIPGKERKDARVVLGLAASADPFLAALEVDANRAARLHSRRIRTAQVATHVQ